METKSINRPLENGVSPCGCNGTGKVEFPFGEGTVNCINCNAAILNDWKDAVGKAALAAHTGSVTVSSRVILEIDRLLNATG